MSFTKEHFEIKEIVVEMWGQIFVGPMHDCLDISEEEYKKTVKVNVMAPWFLLKAVAKRMRNSSDGNPNSISGWGSIVFLTQILGAERGLYPGSAAFGSSLASVQQLARVCF